VKDEAAKLRAKADRALRTARVAPAEGDSEAAVNRAYYAMFYVASALRSRQERQFRKHSAVHAAFGEHFAKPGVIDAKYHRWLLDTFDLRTVGDYGVDATLTADDGATAIEHGADFLSAARLLLRTDDSVAG
jgi:uncharacterized protein (UPF0332 family)